RGRRGGGRALGGGAGGAAGLDAGGQAEAGGGLAGGQARGGHALDDLDRLGREQAAHRRAHLHPLDGARVVGRGVGGRDAHHRGVGDEGEEARGGDQAGGGAQADPGARRGQVAAAAPAVEVEVARLREVAPRGGGGGEDAQDQARLA